MNIKEIEITNKLLSEISATGRHPAGERSMLIQDYQTFQKAVNERIQNEYAVLQNRQLAADIERDGV